MSDRLGGDTMADRLLSIIIPAYRAEGTIERAVASALAIPRQDIEIIAVDDGSDDGTAAILTDMARVDGRLTLLSQNNQGRSAARNLGVRHASGKWLMFIDADDYLLSAALDEFLEACDRCVSALVVFGRSQSDKPNGVECRPPVKTKTITAKEYLDALLWDPVSSPVEVGGVYNHGSAWSRLYDRERVLALIDNTRELFGPFPEGIRFSEDRLFNIAFLKELGDATVEMHPVELYFWDVGESQTCQVFHDDDPISFERFVAHVLKMRSVKILETPESQAVIAREALWQFQRLARKRLDVWPELENRFIEVLKDKVVADAVRSTPYAGLTASRYFWLPAWWFLGVGKPDLAYRLYPILFKTKRIFGR